MSARRGTVLLAVFLVLAVASMVAASLMFRVRAEVSAASADFGRQHAYDAAMSGIRRAMQIVQIDPTDMASWYDNPDAFKNQLVWQDGSVGWYFTIYAENLDDPQEVRYGLGDEAGKINVNAGFMTAAMQPPVSETGDGGPGGAAVPDGPAEPPADAVFAEMLLRLPGMHEELVDCLLDYLDTDSETRTNGAEQDYYDQLPQPYRIKNGPLRTVEELLLVKGFTGALVFGEDANRNGLLDANEDDGDESFPPDNGDGVLDVGLAGLMTTVSMERDVSNAGQPRLSMNADPARLLRSLSRSGLPRQLQDFIMLCRAEGHTFRHPSELLGMSITPGDDQDIGSRQYPGGVAVESGVTPADMALILDGLTARPTGGQPLSFGLVNVNTARAEVLAAIPGLDENLAQAIVAARPTVPPDMRTTPAWLLTEGLVDAEAFKRAAPHLTARSYQYRVRCIGFGHPVGRYCILEAVIDLSLGPPSIVYLRDITRLGLPMALGVEQDRL